MSKVKTITEIDGSEWVESEIAQEMYEMLDLAISFMDGDSIEDFAYNYSDIKNLLAKARGDQQ